MRPLFAFLTLLSLALAGCGGEGGCSGFTTQPSGAYAGAYTATFTPRDPEEDPLTLAFSVSDDGELTGTVTDAVPEPDAQTSVNGTAFDILGCSTGSGLEFQFAFTDIANTLNASRSRKGSILGTYTGFLNGAKGQLVVTRAD